MYYRRIITKIDKKHKRLLISVRAKETNLSLINAVLTSDVVRKILHTLKMEDEFYVISIFDADFLTLPKKAARSR